MNHLPQWDDQPEPLVPVKRSNFGWIVMAVLIAVALVAFVVGVV